MLAEECVMALMRAEISAIKEALKSLAAALKPESSTTVMAARIPTIRSHMDFLKICQCSQHRRVVVDPLNTLLLTKSDAVKPLIIVLRQAQDRSAQLLKRAYELVWALEREEGRSCRADELRETLALHRASVLHSLEVQEQAIFPAARNLLDGDDWSALISKLSVKAPVTMQRLTVELLSA